MKLSQFKNPEERRVFLEKLLNIKLNNINRTFVDDSLTLRVENVIGATSIPLGVAGPLAIENFKFKIKNYFIPLATTEGALVASVNRGCKVVTQSGGAKVFVEKVGATRGPVYYVGSLKKAVEFRNWLNKNENLIKQESEKTSSHLKLLKQEIKIVSPYVFVRFYFDTQDAMGMNMATIATDLINCLIKSKTGIKCLSISGNYCVDKKPAWINFIDSRGFKIWAEAVIPKKIVKDVLKTTPQGIFDVWLAKCLLGSAMSGSLGFNAHYANVVAAFFAATGQDITHTVEGSLGITTVKVLKNSDLYLSIYLPAVMLGTVGGGTKLKTQTEARKIIGVTKSEKLAEVLAGAVLAGELSLLASLAEGSLTKAHERLGR